MKLIVIEIKQDWTLSIKEYHDEINPYLKNIINLNKCDKWKIQLTMAINFMFSRDTDEKHVLHSKSDKIEITINDKADEVIKEIFESIYCRYQISLEISMKGNDFIFDYVNLL